MKENKKILILLGTALSITLALGGAYLFLFFTLKNKTEASATLLEKIEELSGRESRIASSVSVLKKESINIEKVSAYFFKETEVVAFAKKIEALGAQSGTTLTIESLDQGYTEKTVPFLNLRIKATGTFANISRLLFLIDNFPGKIEWKTVSLSGGTGASVSAAVDDKNVKITSSAPEWQASVFLVALNFTNQ